MDTVQTQHWHTRYVRQKKSLGRFETHPSVAPLLGFLQQMLEQPFRHALAPVGRGGAHRCDVGVLRIEAECPHPAKTPASQIVHKVMSGWRRLSGLTHAYCLCVCLSCVSGHSGYAGSERCGAAAAWKASVATGGSAWPRRLSARRLLRRCPAPGPLPDAQRPP